MLELTRRRPCDNLLVRSRIVAVSLVGAALVVSGIVVVSTNNTARCEPMPLDDGLNRQVRLTRAGDWIEFAVWSREPFPMRALFPVMRIGDHEFSRSSYADADGLNTLVFFIPQEDFESLESGDPVSVYYGVADAQLRSDLESSNPWSFGPFNKDLLDCEADIGGR